MKKIISILLLLITIITNAQYKIECNNKTTFKYKVINPNSFILHWNINGGDIINNWNDSVEVKWFVDNYSNYLTVYPESQHGCLGNTKKLDIYLINKPILLDKYILSCDSNYIIDFSLYNNYQFIWNDSILSYKYNVNKDGLVKYDIIEKDCVFKDSVFLTFKKPIILLKDTIFCFDNSKLNISLPNVYNYNWYNNSKTNNNIFDKEGYYWVKFNDDYCSYINNFKIIENCEWFIPSGFSPNNDNQNDYFCISWLNRYHKINIDIYDRWGGLVFTSSDPNFKWNGNNLPMETYYYILNIIDINKEIYNIISILR